MPAIHHQRRSVTAKQAGACLLALALATPALAREPHCGSYRWGIKTLADAPALSKPTPVPLSVLAHFRRPAGMDGPKAPRSLMEREAYVIDADLVELRRERDGDIHAVLRDGDVTLIAELPSAECMHQTKEQGLARGVLATLLGRGKRARLPRRVRITGVLFFDKPHDASGAAPNGAELHPVLDLTLL